MSESTYSLTTYRHLNISSAYRNKLPDKHRHKSIYKYFNTTYFYRSQLVFESSANWFPIYLILTVTTFGVAINPRFNVHQDTSDSIKNICIWTEGPFFKLLRNYMSFEWKLVQNNKNLKHRVINFLNVSFVYNSSLQTRRDFVRNIANSQSCYKSRLYSGGKIANSWI